MRFLRMEYFEMGDDDFDVFFERLIEKVKFLKSFSEVIDKMKPKTRKIEKLTCEHFLK